MLWSEGSDNTGGLAFSSNFIDHQTWTEHIARKTQQNPSPGCDPSGGPPQCKFLPSTLHSSIQNILDFLIKRKIITVKFGDILMEYFSCQLLLTRIILQAVNYY